MIQMILPPVQLPQASAEHSEQLRQELMQLPQASPEHAEQLRQELMQLPPLE